MEKYSGRVGEFYIGSDSPLMAILKAAVQKIVVMFEFNAAAVGDYTEILPGLYFSVL